jgi:arylsulfotransferase ASST
MFEPRIHGAGHLLAFLAVAASGLACSPSHATSDASVDRAVVDAERDRDAQRDVAPEARDTGPKDAGEDGGTPSLIELSVLASSTLDGGDGGDAGPPALTLVPPFSSSIYDYYLRCPGVANALAVSMKASPGANSLLVQPALSGALPSQTLSLNVNENQAIVVLATDGVSTTEYWVRCLPFDFPPMEMQLHAEAGTPPSGYYLLGTSVPSFYARWGYAIVLDGNGVPVWYAQGASGLGVEDVDAVVAGAVSFIPTSDLPFAVHYLDPPMVTTADPSGQEINTHELRVVQCSGATCGGLTNGNYLVISVPITTGVDLTGMSIGLPDGGTEELGPDSAILECELVEFNPATGAVAWTWVASDHLDPVKDSTVPNLAQSRPAPDGGGPVWDVFHCNSIDIDPNNGNLLVSARNTDSVFYVDRSTSQILWKMGGPSYTKDDAAYVSVDDGGVYHQQHDARLQPGWSPTCSGGNGQISLFDDESNQTNPARGLVLDVVVGADGGVADCGAVTRSSPGATLAWQYPGPINSEIRGSFRILSDGSRVIDWGSLDNSSHLVFTEVDVQGNDLKDFYFTDGDVSYRVIKVPLSAFDLGVLRSTAGP